MYAFTALIVLLATATVTPAQQAGVGYQYAAAVHRSFAHQKVVASWEEARRHCERDGAVLASPVTTELLAYIIETYIDVDNHAAAYFIGVRAELDSEHQELRYVSLEGVPLDAMPAGVVNMIEQIDPRDGECLRIDRRRIRAVSCWDRLPYLCYTNETIVTPTTTSTTTEAEIPSTTVASAAALGYTYYSATGRWYKYYQTLVLWDEARVTCQREGGDLVVINDAVEARIISDIVRVGNKNSWFAWTGLRDGRPGGVQDWRSVHGEPIDQLYHKWIGSPADSEDYTCAGFFDMILNDLSCKYYNCYFVCERDA